MNGFALAALVLVIENFVGYPSALFKVVGHPVQWIGKLISYIDEGLNDLDATPDQNRYNGMIAIALLCVAVGVPSYIVAKLLSTFTYGWTINVILATAFIAQKSLRDHVGTVDRSLQNSLADARKEVAKIVGRDPNALDENGVAKAALESLAENTADGITAPIFWYALLGLPGLVIYKAINTADSMIGHKSEKYLNFGWAAAKLDDLVNLPASRLTGLMFSAAAWVNSKAAAQNALRAMWRDSGKHQSPNAGWPESAMAGALGLRFGGPRQYDGETVELPYMGDGRDVEPKDIARGLELYDQALIGLLLTAVLLAMALSMSGASPLP
jgi:adenosylcobinamide-phosphate synthase